MSFFEIFQPEARHLREEKERQKMAIAKPTPGGGAPLGIDLAKGVATITIRAKPAAQNPAATPTDPENIASADEVGTDDKIESDDEIESHDMDLDDPVDPTTPRTPKTPVQG